MITSMRLNDSDLKAGLASLGAKFPSAVVRALRKTAVTCRVPIAQAMSADTGLPINKVKKAILITVKDNSAFLSTKGSPIPLIQFKARGPEPSRGKGHGVVSTASNHLREPHAFIAVMPSGHRGVFQRKPGAQSVKRGRNRVTGSPSWTTLPIEELFGPSLAETFAKFLPLGAARASEALLANLKSEFAFALSRR